MVAIDEASIAHLTRLSRIECTPEERQKLCADLGKILAYVEQLQEIDTKDIEPLSHVLENVSSFMREDIVGELLPQKLFFNNAPETTGGYLKVFSVLKST